MDGARTSYLFLPGCRGPLFAAHDAPAPGRAPLGAVLQLSPFAEEMNRARHLLACQARELAAAGLHVLRVDPYGCGDSAGDFSEARWEIWREDALRSADWLREETSAPVSLWGVRLGALLACDLVAHMDGPPGKLVFWQPVLDGALLLNEFLRVRFASDMLDDAPTRSTTRELLVRIEAGESINVGGYVLAPELASAIGSMRLEERAPRGWEVHWIEMTRDRATGLPPASDAVVRAWRDEGLDVRETLIEGPRFWNTVEPVDVVELRSCTRTAFAGSAP